MYYNQFCQELALSLTCATGGSSCSFRGRFCLVLLEVSSRRSPHLGRPVTSYENESQNAGCMRQTVSLLYAFSTLKLCAVCQRELAAEHLTCLRCTSISVVGGGGTEAYTPTSNWLHLKMLEENHRSKQPVYQSDVGLHLIMGVQATSSSTKPTAQLAAGSLLLLPCRTYC